MRQGFRKWYYNKNILFLSDSYYLEWILHSLEQYGLKFYINISPEPSISIEDFFHDLKK